MSLGLSAYHGSGEFSPRLEYNAKSGRYTKVDRTADGSDVIKVDVTMGRPVFCLDIGSIEIGWINFQYSIAPSFEVVPFGQPMPPRPDRAFKAGFRSKIWIHGDTACKEFSANAGVTVDAIEALWDQLAVLPEARAGQLPVLRATDVVGVASARGTNYSPVLELVMWIDRDEAVFGPRTVAAPGAPPIAPPVAVPAPATPGPAAWTAPAPAAPTPATWATPAKKAA
jgi:hypothetical protein